MTVETGQPSSKRKQSGGTLLPVSGTLLPPSGPSNAGTNSGEALVDDVADQLGRAGTEARELASRAAALAVEKAPEIKKKAQEATKKMSGLASRAFKEAEASAQAATATLADPEKRKAAISANKRRLAVGFAALVVVMGGGWAFAKHQATSIARDRVDGFLLRYNLRANVAYDDISASPFGSATLTGVVIKDPHGSVMAKVGALGVSGIEMKGDVLQGITVAAKSFEVPFLPLTRGWLRDPVTYNLIGMGYTTITGDISVAGRIDDKDGTFSFETKGSLRDLGDWRGKLKLGGVSAAALGPLSALSQTDPNNPFAALGPAIIGLSTLAQQTTLAEISLSLDDSGYFKRNKEVTNAELPPDDASQAVRIVSVPIDESELVRAGISPSEAKADHEAIDTWVNKGGTIRIESNLDRPIPLFSAGNNFFGAPNLAFASPAAFFAAAKMKISN